MSGDFGDVLKQLREDRGLSINQLAIYSGVSAGLISKIENKKRGIPKPKTIEKLAKGLKIKYEELMQKAGHITKSGSPLSQGSADLKEIIDLSQDDAIKKIMNTFSYKGNDITEDQAKTIYFLSLGILNKD